MSKFNLPRKPTHLPYCDSHFGNAPLSQDAKAWTPNRSIAAAPSALLLALALAAAAIMAVGCARKAAVQPPPPSVTVAPVHQQEIVEHDEFTGRTEAVNAV